MPIYERLDESGRVAERVRVNNNSYEDNRLGLAAEDSTQPWRVAEKPKPAEPENLPILVSESSDDQPDAKKKR